jgi:hypothetical protein
MYKIIKPIALTLLLPLQLFSQSLFNNGATIQTQTGSILSIHGAFSNQSASDFRNAGTVHLKGNLINHQFMGNVYPGELILSGSSLQTHSGSAAFLTGKLTINNPNQVMNNNTLIVNGECKFVHGIFNAPAASSPLQFTQNSIVSIANPASNASHVNGYVVRQGTGSFTFPVGDGTVYQPVATNLSSNPNGIRVAYVPADAGTGTMSTSGTESTALISYNPQEYWDIAPLTSFVAPIGSATGTVTVFWDAYRNPPISQVSTQKVAHKNLTSWFNEGTNAIGNLSSGSVTSNPISTWGLFTLGEICVPPTMNTISLNSSICNGQSTTISASGAATYTWQPGNLNGASVTVSPTTTTTYTVTGTTAGGCSATTTRVITVNPCSTTVNLKLFIEGYYDGGGFMKPVLMNQGVVGATALQTDTITVELRNQINPSLIISNVKTVLNTNGTATCSFPVTGLYYLVIKHRNALQTWSSNPLLFSGSTLNYDFTNAANKAYGANQAALGAGFFGFYSCDFNGDENIDLVDLGIQEVDINNFESGYFATDLNGDGNVDILDLPKLEDNINNFLFSVHP